MQGNDPFTGGKGGFGAAFVRERLDLRRGLLGPLYIGLCQKPLNMFIPCPVRIPATLTPLLIGPPPGLVADPEG